METDKYKGKRATFVLENDKFAKGKTLTVNYQTPSLDRFCDYLGEVLSSRNGSCIRRIYSAGGTPVTGLDNFRAGHIYVASTKDTYTRIRYREISPRRPANLFQGKYHKIDINHRVHPVIHSQAFKEVSGKAKQQAAASRGKLIHLFVSDGTSADEHSFVVHPTRHKSLVEIQTAIADQLGCFQNMNIYEVSPDGKGQLIRDADYFQPGNSYLVIKKDQDKNHDSKKVKKALTSNAAKNKAAFILKNVSPRHGQHYNSQPFPKLKPVDKGKRDRSFGRKIIPPIIGDASSKQSGPISPFSNNTSQGSRKQHSNKSRTSRQVDYDEDQGGVFRAKGTDNAKGAKQVNETRDTRTERPIDQMEAEEVEEEDFPSKEKTTPIPPGTELNKKPSKETKQDKDVKKQKNSEEKLNEDQNKGKRQDQWDDSFNENDRHNDQRQSTPASTHEARLKEEQQRAEAATKVQAGVRGHLARKEIKAKKEEKKRLQDEMRREDERRQHEDDDRRRDDEERHEKEKAATKIQAGFKGYKARKDVREKRQGQK